MRGRVSTPVEDQAAASHGQTRTELLRRYRQVHGGRRRQQAIQFVRQDRATRAGRRCRRQTLQLVCAHRTGQDFTNISISSPTFTEYDGAWNPLSPFCITEPETVHDERALFVYQKARTFANHIQLRSTGVIRRLCGSDAPGEQVR